MIEKEKYDKINYYLNLVSSKNYNLLMYNYLVYADYLKAFGSLFDHERNIIDKALGGKKGNTNQKPINELSIFDTLDICSSILESIDDMCGTSYKSEFTNLVNNGVFDFDFRDRTLLNPVVYNSSSSFQSFHIGREKNQLNIFNRYIDVVLTHTYNDVCTIIHEFFHYTNAQKNDGYSRPVLTEAFSIYFEGYAIDYLIKNNICSAKDLNLFSRLFELRKITVKSRMMMAIGGAFVTQGSISDDTFNYLKVHKRGTVINEEDYIKYINNLYNTLCKYEEEGSRLENKNRYKTVENYIVNKFNVLLKRFNYGIGTLIAYFEMVYGNIYRMVSLNKELSGNRDIEYYMERLEFPLEEIKDVCERDKIDENDNSEINLTEGIIKIDDAVKTIIERYKDYLLVDNEEKKKH